jgi:hypothetical protein
VSSEGYFALYVCNLYKNIGFTMFWYCCISLIFVRYLRRVRTISVVRTVVAAVCEAHYKGISAHFVHRIACYYRTAAATLPHRTYITLWLASIAPALHNNVRRLSEQSIVGIVYTT